MTGYRLPLDRLYLAQLLSEPAFGKEGAHLYFVRQADGKRSIVRQSMTSGLAQALTTTPAPKGGIGYGGSLFTVREPILVYAAEDGRLHRIELETGAQEAVTPAYEGVAAPVLSPCGRFVAFLAEQDGRCNVLVADMRPGPEARAFSTLQLSEDPWYAFNPIFSPDGSRVAWQEWDEAAMPWDESRLCLATLSLSTPSVQSLTELLPLERTRIAHEKVSHGSPQFSPDGKHLAYISDESGWRSLWVAESDGSRPDRVDLGEGEVGKADWIPGLKSFYWHPQGDALYAARRHRGQDTLLLISWPGRSVREIPTSCSTIDGFCLEERNLAVLGSTPTHPARLFTIDSRNGGETVRATSAIGLVRSEALREPEWLTWKGPDQEPVHGHLYRAIGPEAPAPLIVQVHGGPTSENPRGWDPQAQYFATRGWHYLVVNHRGSTGYGRRYQDRLLGQWGVCDVADVASGARHAIELGLADPQRLVITGGSAGGYTTLMALCQEPELWAAGVALYGIGNLYDLMLGSHRFEVHYEESLIGRLPEAGPLWKERSPLTHVHRVAAPVLLFHGKDDRAVPYRQSVEFAEAVRSRGGTAELISYEGEGHGFVREANRRDVIEKMEAFLKRYVIDLQG